MINYTLVFHLTTFWHEILKLHYFQRGKELHYGLKNCVSLLVQEQVEGKLTANKMIELRV